MLTGAQTVKDKSEVAPVKEKLKKPRFESEDYCLTCRDGGCIVLCDHCPRGTYYLCHPCHSD